ncbi:histidine kinase [Lampropedia cohaerens]|uniref:Sensor protein n=1 Tax=Lampropedia cohaerens TaxID=1610491 RepID=A0A0U1Q093_9BURK|nr:type IV pili methyl-accepting chemotaxis transducer N-terminal domain-containing protein [Lampropedia cohaerens]KKW68183.1 histidine kinase [Lampropedia cohaerens]
MESFDPTLFPPWRKRISTRIVASSVVALLVVLGMIGLTLWLSWRLEGAGAAINDTGSLRMRSYRIAVELASDAPNREERVMQQFEHVFQTLTLLRRGDAQRPLLLPDDAQIRAQLDAVSEYWQEVAYPLARMGLETGDTQAYLASLRELVARADQLVQMIEHDNAGKTTALRLAQGGLAVLAVVGTLAMICLLYLWIIVPVLRLSQGLRRMAAHEFDQRLPVETQDEFGVLAAGFNQMARELQGLYGALEQRVAEKTSQLAAQNHEIASLYEMAAFLNQPGDIEAMCEGFLQRVTRQFGAAGASIRTLDVARQQVSLVASVGLSPALLHAEHCMPANDCHCGEATLGPEVIVIRDVTQTGDASRSLPCAREGFATVAVFRIVSGESVLGSFSLHFHRQRVMSDSSRQLLESLGQLLGVALENRRLAAQARELAVVQERGLVAQGLHDSLAQGLNFLNLQLQLMEDAMRRGDIAEVREILPLLRTGVDESYQDVRELLTNFRSKLEQGDLGAAIEQTVQRFRRQTGLQTALDIQHAAGAPLALEQQLQVLFILQEALSNIRKHAEASHVKVRVENAQDFTLSVEDDGRGYDPQEVADRGEGHVGLHIMRERAARMNATIHLDSAPGQGTRVSLLLPARERLPA